jgi:hypothetical protein
MQHPGTDGKDHQVNGRGDGRIVLPPVAGQEVLLGAVPAHGGAPVRTVLADWAGHGGPANGAGAGPPCRRRSLAQRHLPGAGMPSSRSLGDGWWIG